VVLGGEVIYVWFICPSTYLAFCINLSFAFSSIFIYIYFYLFTHIPPF
jgi:hypothetical protein